jgi:lysophospholipase L1-like esterase
MPKAKQILSKLGLAAGAILIMLLVAEIGLRVAGISYPRTVQADPVLGAIHRPGVAFHFHDEGDAWVEFNSDGFRDVEWPVEKPTGEFRIAVLGDSYVEAVQVPVEERLTEVLAHELSDEPAFAGRSVRVMNFGMAGYGTGQELLLLRDRVAKYHPDLVVLAVLTGNDLSDNCRALRPHSQRPFFLLRDGQLVLDDSFQDWVASENRLQTRLLYGLADWSRIVQLAYRVRKNLHAKAEIARALARRGDGPQELGLDDQVYVEPTTPAWREAWDITEHLLLAIKEEARALGAKLLVVTLSNGEQVHPDPAERKQFADRLGVRNLDYPDTRIAHFCDEHGIAALTLAPTMRSYAEANHVYLHGFENTELGRGHWNQAGHRLAADLTAKKIVELLSNANASSSTAD